MKENDNYHNELFYISSNMQYYEQMMAISLDPHIRMFYENLLNSEIRQFNESQWYYNQIVNLKIQENETIQSEQRKFAQEELAEYDGSGGSTHFSLYAGKDLTAQFSGCHQGNLMVLRNLPQVGSIQD